MPPDKYESEHFHDKEKGCKLEDTQMPGRSGPGKAYGSMIICSYCTTHNIVICRCGWEWHWHHGTYSYASNMGDRSVHALSIPFTGFKKPKQV